ncbi:hypothetical protein GQ457_04G021450 [Hibiscus cannabinus]
MLYHTTWLISKLDSFKGAIPKFLTSRASEDYEPLKFDFSNEDLMSVVTMEEGTLGDKHCKLNFDGASNVVGNRNGTILVSLEGNHYSFVNKLDFDCTNNTTKYETCTMGIQASIEQKIKILKVYEDSMLVNLSTPRYVVCDLEIEKSIKGRVKFLHVKKTWSARKSF